MFKFLDPWNSLLQLYNTLCLPIFLRIASLSLGLLCEHPSASEATLEDMGKIKQKTKCKLCAYSVRQTIRVCLKLNYTSLMNYQVSLLLNFHEWVSYF